MINKAGRLSLTFPVDFNATGQTLNWLSFLPSTGGFSRKPLRALRCISDDFIISSNLQEKLYDGKSVVALKALTPILTAVQIIY